MSDKFQFLMKAVDEDLLEEAMTYRKKKSFRPWIGAAVAACLLMVLTLPMLFARQDTMTMENLAQLGYEIHLPDTAEDIRCEVLALENGEAAQVSFTLQDTAYVYRAVKTDIPQPLQGGSAAAAELISWNAGEVELEMLTEEDSRSVSWYTPDNGTQCYLSAEAEAAELLTTASQILHKTGLNVTVAPEGAENITYSAFTMEELTVAETTFCYEGVTYAYRMAATMEITEDFADISGMDVAFAQRAEGEVLWCPARISCNDGQQGKIVWFDVVPGILYSLSMDSGASVPSLQDMANELFAPAQGDN